jgi:hypothetical protein
MNDFYLSVDFKALLVLRVKAPSNTTYRNGEDYNDALECKNIAVKGLRPVFQFNETHISK